MTRLRKIEGIGDFYEHKLEDNGIHSQEELLEQCGRAYMRKQVAKRCNLSEKLLLKWLNRADLARVKGIGEEYADLLEAAGVDTVRELRLRNPENLYRKLAEVNNTKNLVRKLPTFKMVQDWIQQCQQLPRMIFY